MNKELYEKILSSTYKFGQVDGIEFTDAMKFWDDGRISGYHNDHEFFLGTFR